MTAVATIARPRWAYVPGEGGGVDREAMACGLALLSPSYADRVPADDAAVGYGIALNDEGFFWEAHEVLEAVWRAAPPAGLDRLVLRGCIQIANANLKRRMSRPAAAARLMAEAAADFAELGRRGPAPTDSFAGRIDLTRIAAGFGRPGPILIEPALT
ncbi:DUF309 domain-containing protein [Bradyrhizobium sp. WD16]|uniref:DUF309 domain-containing protein n=1 Tax=Bradyrhizobium sp. WD16 TaxID=1521768 RepID=UPI0020A2BEBA|nr:DUF309 domain-containing protein [Bradyrhizobium sp. WD16]